MDALRPDVRRPVQPSKYRVDKIALGSIIDFESENYREYQCKPSDQFQGFAWCQKQKNERVPRGEYLSSYSILHNESGRISYLNRYLEPAFFDPGEAGEDVARLSRAFGEQPRTIDMPQSGSNLTGVITSLGRRDLRAAGPRRIEHVSDRPQSRRYPDRLSWRLPAIDGFEAADLSCGGGPGFVWAESHDMGGRGRLRFFAIDASSLSTTRANAIPPIRRPDQARACRAEYPEKTQAEWRTAA